MKTIVDKKPPGYCHFIFSFSGRIGVNYRLLGFFKLTFFCILCLEKLCVFLFSREVRNSSKKLFWKLWLTLKSLLTSKKYIVS